MENEFAVILVAGLAVFGLFYIAGQELNTGQQDTQELVLFEENFGSVGDATQDLRTVNFGDFSVGEGRGDVQAYRSEQETINNRILGQESIRINYNATAPRNGFVEFEVLGKDGKGAMYVTVNGQNIFEEKLVTTGTPEINISEDYLKPGENEIIIGTRKGGIFSSTEYAIEDVEIMVNDRKFHDYEDSFRVYEYEKSDFAGANLTFTLPQDSSTRTQPLEVYLNDEEIFSDSISRSDQSIQLERDQLNVGYNTLRFETEGEARYDLENADLSIRYFGTITPGTANTQFDLSQQDLDYVDREDTEEYVQFDYMNLMPSNNPVRIELNDYTETFDPNSFNSIKIPEDTLQEQNSVELSSNGSFNVQNFDVVSRVVQE